MFDWTVSRTRMEIHAIAPTLDATHFPEPEPYLTMKVSVKWTSNKYDLDLDPSQPPIAFKTQLFSLTGVSPDRMKLLFKGTQVKDDDAWTKFKGLQDGAAFMMMGTAGELPKPPSQPVVFVEDLKPGQSASGVLIGAPLGLTNLGNTCYLNATLQCLRTVKELQGALEQDAANKGYSGDMMGNVTVSLRDLYKQLNAQNAAAVDAIPPIAFLTAFRAAYPQFAEQDQRTGAFAQQDAEEAWNQLLTAVKSSTAPKSSSSSSTSSSSSAATGSLSSIERLMGIQFHNTTTCDDPAAAAAGEMATEHDTSDLRITCHISNTTNNVNDSLAESLVQKLEKNSAALGRSATYSVKSQISRLPKYLTIHFARFFWRADIKQRVKIRRNVAYSAELDMYKYCSPDLQAKLSTKRDKDELCAVLTHIGASSNSGHYIGWAKQGKDWFKFDDDKVSPISEADVLKNSGSSADGHIAYLLLYRAKEE
ncbi:hypothetical protein BCR44DRAFT_1441417 [Catenaria anguillulae PL171]|uniref:ubiquitinyl hydrolase 1 n=1 Tax=Catenaria anguillulae PL171 TaxID=765915 RepID=A0A1Y2HFH2_9FUNG|nr:hypothetical protein BCR44DRAFT_1441417 [Catenaria anguillulae PL171]